jgi:aminomethyltransferase
VILDCEPLTVPKTTFWEIKKYIQQVGKITSAVYSPRLKQNIALAMVSINNSEIGTVLDVKMNDKIVKATIVEKPFYDPKKKLASS